MEYNKFHPMYYYLEYVFPGRFKDKCDKGDEYNFVGSYGTGGFPHVLSLSILDKDITKKPTENIYVVYLFSKHFSNVYLSLSISSSQYKSKQQLLDAKRAFQNFIDEKHPMVDCLQDGMDLELGANNNSIAKSFPDGSILFKKYEANEIPEDEVLFRDLKKFLELYKFIKENYSDTRYIDLLNKKQYDPFSEDDLYKDIYMDNAECKKLRDLVLKKKNVILQGPPGVGKTYIAKLLPYSILKEKNDELIQMVQFHQSYSYEDFFMGYKPDKDGFELINGPFYKFCKKAELNPGKEHYFIIDEINRGDLSKIFGELFMLIENDKRGEDYKIKLLYRDEYFYIPENVYIIGLMNTADRSIAMVDYALRRRFAFFDLKPGFESKNFKEYQETIINNFFNGEKNNLFCQVIDQIKNLNKKIFKDDALGDGFCIGHSYFCNLEKSKDTKELVNNLKLIIDYEILPMLNEYWFDDKKNVNIENFETLSKKLENNLLKLEEG